MGLRKHYYEQASVDDWIPAELFKILKDDSVNLLHSICQQIWKTQQWSQDRKRSVFIPIPKKGNAKECSNYCTTVLISHASKVVLKILETRLQQHVNWELPGIQAGFKNAEEPGIKLPAFNDLDSIIKNQRHYFDDKDPYSQSYGFSSSHIWVWELDHQEG